jgi:Transposase DDE domain group 1
VMDHPAGEPQDLLLERLEARARPVAARRQSVGSTGKLQHGLGLLLTSFRARPAARAIERSSRRARQSLIREDVNDAERLARDPTMRAMVGKPVVKFYNGRDMAEQWIKEGKNALRWTRLSCHAFRHNAVRLQLHALACNLANFVRTLALPADVEHWSLTTLREKLVKIGARIVCHGRYVVFPLAEVAVPRAPFTEILRRIDRLRLRPPPVPA